ncbi:RrF2 family transcriptional regulator [Mediterraneibacter massiliensis]|uniref:RrF2 family transcriptional regulator n=1 Tax=Mediterraneibacter massiliensis TaxID=1720300 RepID=UPI000E493E59|nr:Rrf2 family transcriptional regulator [Mediterraneibacter massiliensis]RGT73161.1 Rrf2 family transcriptional regulator [Ruminococcus sp. AF18-22]
MKLSTKGRYGLRALIDLAQYSENGPVSITNISGRQDISERYLEQLMAKLKKAGIVESIRGAAGGYLLAKPMEEISVGEVLRALEGSLEPVECAGLGPGNGCSASDICVTKYVWQRINESINQAVDEIKLEQLVEESKKKQHTADRVSKTECGN